MSLADLAERNLVAGRAAQLALRWRGRNGRRRDFSFGDLAALSDRLAGHLLALGVQPQESVAVMTGRRPETVILALAIWKIGATYCPLFTDLGPDPLLARLQVAQPKILLVDNHAYSKAIKPLHGQLDFLSALVFLGDKLPPDCRDLNAMLEADVAEPRARPDGATAGILHFTSGTTAPASVGSGRPRAILHDQRILPRLVDSASFALGLKEGDMIWCTGEPGWVVHGAFGIIAPLALGAASVMDEAPMSPGLCIALLEEEPVDIWYTTPTVIRGLIGAGAAACRSLRGRPLRVAASVGEPLSADAVEWGARVLGVPFRDSWWQTETGGIVLAHAMDETPRPGSMGKALPGQTVRLVERMVDCLCFLPDEGEATGEITLLASALAPWQSLGGEQGAPAEDVDGWHLTHDIARRDASGNYWYLGREDEVINLEGRMVGPFEVEAVLMAHPAVAEVGVVGAPDPASHEHLVAFVGLHPGFDPGRALRDELHDYAVEHLGSILAPKDIRFELQLPRTSSGKIIRRSLKNKLIP